MENAYPRIYPAIASRDIVLDMLFDEGHGQQVNDASQFRNHGIMVNMEEADWVSGPDGRGHALKFDGVNEYAEVKAGRISDATEGFLSFWINISVLADQKIFFGYGGANVATPGMLWFGIRDVAGNFRLSITQRSDGVAPSVVVGSTNLAVAIWYHILFASNGTAWLMYLNGVAEVVGVVAGANNGNWFGDTVVTAPSRTVMGALYYDGGLTAFINAALSRGLLSDKIPSAEDVRRLCDQPRARYSSGLGGMLAA